MAGTKKRKHSDADVGADAVVPVGPTLQAQAVPQGEAGSKYPEGSVGALRDFFQIRINEMGLTYEVAKGIPEFILQKPMSELEKGESWKVGSFGGVRIYAEKDQGFYSIDSDKPGNIDHYCKLMVAGKKNPVITLLFATEKSDKLIEEWCEKHGITLKRVYPRPEHKASKDDKKSDVTPPKPTADTSKKSSSNDASATKTSSESESDAASKDPSSASVKFR